jgi:hypothetical protein
MYGRISEAWVERLSRSVINDATPVFLFFLFFFGWRCDPTRVMASSFLRFLDHTQQRTTVGRTHLDEWSAHRKDLYLTTQHSQQTNIYAPGGNQTHDLSRRAAADLRHQFLKLYLLKPTGHVMHHQFNIQQLYALPTLFICFIFIWEQKATCANYSINCLVFTTEIKSVYCAVRTGSLNKAVCALSLKG